MEQIIDLLLDAKETMAWILLIAASMLCLAANSFTPTHDKDGRLGKTCAIVIVGLMLLFGLASL